MDRDSPLESPYLLWSIAAANAARMVGLNSSDPLAEALARAVSTFSAVVIFGVFGFGFRDGRYLFKVHLSPMKGTRVVMNGIPSRGGVPVSAWYSMSITINAIPRATTIVIRMITPKGIPSLCPDDMRLSVNSWSLTFKGQGLMTQLALCLDDRVGSFQLE